MNAVQAAVALAGRLDPDPAGAAGLALGLLVIAVLTLHQVRPHWRDRQPPGAVLARRPVGDAEAGRVFWVSATVLLVVLGVVVVERIAVLT